MLLIYRLMLQDQWVSATALAEVYMAHLQVGSHAMVDQERANARGGVGSSDGSRTPPPPAGQKGRDLW